MELEEGDIVLCTVERVEKTVVFVKIHSVGKELEGSITISEIAPGRIRNIRDYVVPNKKIVCEVLRISGDRIDLSLRRVTKKEQKEVMEHYNQERSYISLLRGILKEKGEEAIKKIQEKGRLYDFIEESKENPEKLEKLIGKENSDKVLKIIKIQKQKKVVIKKEFHLSSFKPDGIKLIKSILDEIKDAEIKYISAGRYSIIKQTDDPKKSDQKLTEILKEISEKAKRLGMKFEIKEK